MLESRVDIVQANLRRTLAAAPPSPRSLADGAPVRPGSSLTAARAREIFRYQVQSRILDVMARELKARGEGFYTISSAGHEQNAIVGAQLRPTDPCFLHYRSGGLMMARSAQDPSIDPIRDTLLSMCASADDPISGGRHKVWGSRPLWVPPQTSTIASHLPKAMGTAFALGRRERLDHRTEHPEDAIVLCSFGDASANHATALSGINAARYSFRRGNPTPVLFLCEDNRVGISVEKPRRWISDSFAGLSQMDYLLAEGEMDEIWDVVAEAIDRCRGRRRPVFLRLPTVRLWGHAGSDVETTYRTVEEIEEVEAQDPLLQNALRLLELGAATPQDLLATVESVEAEARATAEEVVSRPRLGSVAEVVAPLAPYDPDAVRAITSRPLDPAAREQIFDGRLPEDAKAPTKRSLASHINSALHDEMLRHREIVVFGEDVAKKGGVYYVTSGLQERFGPGRVFDTLLDETTILGVAQGLAHIGLLPVPEIQYLAYLHNAIDQLRGEAASLQFFSNGQFSNPMVVRIAGLAYQRGFGGHFHNDNSLGALREIPGLVLAVPSRGDDAARMLRGCLALARACGRVVAFLEPIALYHEKDLHEEGDRGWLSDYPAPHEALLPGEVGIHAPSARDLLVVTYCNGVRMAVRAARRLAEESGLRVRTLDLRWLNPLPLEAVRRHAGECARVLVVDECRATGAGIADAVLADLAERDLARPTASVRAVDTYIPLGPAADLVLVSEDGIVDAARRLCS